MYDITSKRYDQIDFVSLPAAPLTVQSPEAGYAPTCSASLCTLTDENRVLAASGLPVSADQFLSFVSTAIAERELSKFRFSVVLSDCLEAIAAIGEIVGLTREDAAYLTVDDIRIAAAGLPPREVRARWRDQSSARRAEWTLSAGLRLPSVITDVNDLLVVQERKMRPNFVTSQVVAGDVVLLSGGAPRDLQALRGKIVAVEAADPGFDWLFSCGIGALVTKHGGMASHMAIRCGIMGVPAVIGCGESAFREISKATQIRIDCQSQQIAILG